MKLPEELTRLLEGADFNFAIYADDDDTEIEFQKFSSAGQDFHFSVDAEDDLSVFAENILRLYNDFDVSAEAYLYLDSEGHGRNGAPYDMKAVYEDMEECRGFILELYHVVTDYLNQKQGKSNDGQEQTKRLHIKMAYTFVGDTYIDVPAELTLEEAAEYAQEHLSEIPVAENAEYIMDSDYFDLDDCEF